MMGRSALIWHVRHPNWTEMRHDVSESGATGIETGLYVSEAVATLDQLYRAKLQECFG